MSKRFTPMMEETYRLASKWLLAQCVETPNARYSADEIADAIGVPVGRIRAVITTTPGGVPLGWTSDRIARGNPRASSGVTVVTAYAAGRSMLIGEIKRLQSIAYGMIQTPDVKK